MSRLKLFVDTEIVGAAWLSQTSQNSCSEKNIFSADDSLTLLHTEMENVAVEHLTAIVMDLKPDQIFVLKD